MENHSLKPVIEQLDQLFENLNQHFYNHELEKPILAINTNQGRNILGWCTAWKVWGTHRNESLDSEDGYYEINISAEYLNRPFAEISETMLHEMAHLYNLQHQIQDTSRSGKYHNKHFKEAAEAHGLICSSVPKYGLADTKLTPEALQYVESLNLCQDFGLYRKVAPSVKKKSAYRKYVCPSCGQIVRATGSPQIICAKCNVMFAEEK